MTSLITEFIDAPPAARVICDSISDLGHRITTMEVKIWRPMLAEFNTHRQFSRNSASSRAIPITIQLKKIKDNPGKPMQWPCEQPGMQGGNELDGIDLHYAKELWDTVYNDTILSVEHYLQGVKERYPLLTKDELKAHTLHKSVINRLLEPYMWQHIVVTATQWENFFRQRCSPLAQPEFRYAAEAMEKAYRTSVPEWVGMWGMHLPYVEDELKFQTGFEALGKRRLAMVSAARCAKVSVRPFSDSSGTPDPEKDLELAEKLQRARPMHASPFEHPASPSDEPEFCKNFIGWRPLRTDLEMEMGLTSKD